MSYTPTNWSTGDVITAEKLNNMESGIENANQNVYIATLSYDGSNYSCDKTPEQIKSAADGGAAVFLRRGESYNMNYLPLCSVEDEDGYIYTTFITMRVANPAQNSFKLYQEDVHIRTEGVTVNMQMYEVTATKVL